MVFFSGIVIQGMAEDELYPVEAGQHFEFIGISKTGGGFVWGETGCHCHKLFDSDLEKPWIHDCFCEVGEEIHDPLVDAPDIPSVYGDTD